MPRTPSKGIDQNLDGKFIDKYWGRVPQFLRLIPEAYICEANPEYIELMQMYVAGSITEDNLSQELFNEISNIVLNIGCPCLLEGNDRALLNAYLGNETCPIPSHTLTCTDSVCCNSYVRCESLAICDQG